MNCSITVQVHADFSNKGNFETIYTVVDNYLIIQRLA